MRAGQLLKALARLRNAKAKWFNGDTIYGAILTIRYLGSIYSGLGLMYAAKTYVCTAAALAMMSDDIDMQVHVPKTLLGTAKCVQQTGTWVDAARLTEVVPLACAQLLTDPFDYDRHPNLATHHTNATLELAGIRIFQPKPEPLIEVAHKTTNWYKYLVEVVEQDDSQFDMTEYEFQVCATSQLTGPLLGDVDHRRLIDFQALGVHWTFQLNNNRETVLTAEGSVAMLQVLLADIAPMNPVLIKSTTWVAIDMRPGTSREDDSIGIDDSGPKVLANAALSNSLTDSEAYNRAIPVMCHRLLHAVHVHPPGELQDLLEPLLGGGLIHKVSIGRPYEEIAALPDDDHYALCVDVSRPLSPDVFQPTGCEHLSASTVTSPGYDCDESLQAIRERYEVADEALRFTLPRLLSD